jgi:hypothetical protein
MNLGYLRVILEENLFTKETSSFEMDMNNTVPPEVIQGKKWTKEFDYWNFGSILFRMITGQQIASMVANVHAFASNAPPWFSPTLTQLFSKVYFIPTQSFSCLQLNPFDSKILFRSNCTHFLKEWIGKHY